MAAVILLVAQAIALWLFSAAHTVPVYLWHLTGDALQTKLHGATVTAPAAHELWRPDLVYVAVASFFIAALGYAIVLAVVRGRYEGRMKQMHQLISWLVTAVMSSTLVVMLGLVIGLNTVDQLLLLVISVIVAGLLAVLLELQVSRTGKLDMQSKILVIVAAVAAGAPLLVGLITLVATMLFGTGVMAGYSWALYGVVLVGWLLLAGNLHLMRAKRGKWSNYLYGEAWHVGLALAIETAFVWTLFAAVLHP